MISKVNMLITNFRANGKDLYTLWDGKANIAAWDSIDDVPATYLDLARIAKRLPVTKSQYRALAKSLKKRKRNKKLQPYETH
jgi:hypothetical protein